MMPNEILTSDDFER